MRGVGLGLVVSLLGWLARADTLPEIAVTADRLDRPSAAVASPLTVLDRDDLAGSGTLTIDDALRSVAGFTTFRRTGSLTANPTSQGVSLRGLGGSGASRTLVLLDGLPLNDPFGGWIPWSLVPTSSLDRVELVRGPGATVWGSGALGGTIRLFTRPPDDTTAEWRGLGGSAGTVATDVHVAAADRALGVALDAGHRRTDGWYTVPRSQRGPIDEPAASRDTTAHLRLRWQPAPDDRIDLHVAGLDETRDNGTPYTDNASRMLLVGTTGRTRTADGSEWSLAANARVQTFASRFAAAGTRRATERPAADQFTVPSTAGGAAVAWARAFADRLDAAAGLDGTIVDAATNEDGRFDGERFTVRRRASGQSLLGGGFATLRWQPAASVTTVLGGRLDVWRLQALRRRERSLGTGEATVDERATPRTSVVPTPSLALRWQALPQMALRLGGSTGFRAPTLNELTRSFRVRQNVTNANPALRPERSRGGEIGIDLGDEAIGASLTGFWIDVRDAIAARAVVGAHRDALCPGLPASGRCTERANLEALESRGIELAAHVTRLPFVVGGSWTLQDVHLRDGHHGLDGRRPPQVPDQQGTLRCAWHDASGATAAVEMRYLGRQYDDDRNRHPLGGVVLLNAHLGWRVNAHVELFLHGENLADRTVPVGRSDVTTIGAPRLFHGGMTLRF